MLSKPKWMTNAVWPLLISQLVSIQVFDWVEKKLFGHTTGIGIMVGWLLPLAVYYGINRYRNSK